MRELPKYRAAEFRDFLHVHGCTDAGATAELKLEWLLAIIKKGNNAFPTLEALASGLEAFGPPDLDVRIEQSQIVRGYIREIRRSRAFPPPRRPMRAMGPSAFRQLVVELRRQSRQQHRITRKKLRTALLLVWSTGLRVNELSAMRRKWLHRQSGCWLISCHSLVPSRNRVLVVPRSKDRLFCPATALTSWLCHVPEKPDSYIFPHTNTKGITSWRSPTSPSEWTTMMHRLLRRVGIGCGYSFRSLRLAYLKRSLETQGEVVTFLLSGFSRPRDLKKTLRHEPNWSSQRSLFDG